MTYMARGSAKSQMSAAAFSTTKMRFFARAGTRPFEKFEKFSKGPVAAFAKHLNFLDENSQKQLQVPLQKCFKDLAAAHARILKFIFFMSCENCLF